MLRLLRPRLTQVVPVLAVLATGLAVVSPTRANEDFDRAVEITLRMTEKLQSYDVSGLLVMENRAPGVPEGLQAEMRIRGAARWPDRLAASQQSEFLDLNLGTGPGGSWFYLGQAGNCYVGDSVPLNRTLGEHETLELEEDQVFNFFTGLGQFLLNRSLVVEPQTGSETLTVAGRQIPCQVFRVKPKPDAPPLPNGLREGEKAYWFDPASGLVVKASLIYHADQGGTPVEQGMTFTLQEFTLDVEPDAARFTYTPPTGARIVDTLARVTNPDAMTGLPAPDISFQDFAGKTINLADYRGKVVFLDFWATWCGPCRMEMPHIQTLYQELGAGGDVVFLGASSEAKETIEAFLKKNPYTFPIVRVKQQDAASIYRISSIPAGFVIDREGVIRAHLIGAQTERQLREALAKAGVGG